MAKNYILDLPECMFQKRANGKLKATVQEVELDLPSDLSNLVVEVGGEKFLYESSDVDGTTHFFSKNRKGVETLKLMITSGGTVK